MAVMTFPWERPATVSMELILAGRAYAEEHSLPGYDAPAVASAPPGECLTCFGQLVYKVDFAGLSAWVECGPCLDRIAVADPMPPQVEARLRAAILDEVRGAA